MLKTEKLEASGKVTLKAVIIDNDVAFAAKVKTMLRRVGGQPNVDARWSVMSVPTDTLKRPGHISEVPQGSRGRAFDRNFCSTCLCYSVAPP